MNGGAVPGGGASGGPVFNERITVYSRHGRSGQWVKTEVSGASWCGGAAARAVDGGLRGAGRVVVRIPEGAMPPGWLAPDVFAALETPDGHWSLQCGDVLAKGHGLPGAAFGIGEIMTPGRFVVTGVRDNRRGAAGTRHLLVEGSE